MYRIARRLDVPDCAPHPGDHFAQQDRDEEHPLGVGQMGDREDRQPRLALRRVEQPLNVERLAFHPGGEAGRGEQVVELHRQLEALLGRKEALQVDHADLVEAAAIWIARISAAMSRLLPVAPGSGRGCSTAGCARGS